VGVFSEHSVYMTLSILQSAVSCREWRHRALTDADEYLNVCTAGDRAGGHAAIRGNIN